MNKQKSYHHPTKNPNFFCNMKLFFSVQLGHLKLSGYGLLSTQGVQNRSQNCWIVSQSEVILQYMRDPGAPAELGPKGAKATVGKNKEFRRWTVHSGETIIMVI